MGNGRDKRKKAKEKKDGPQVGKGADKTERKTERNELKKERRVERSAKGDEDDIDALLAKVALEDAAKKEVKVESGCPPPSARVNASFIPHITPQVSEILMFGGEYLEPESGKVRVYNDLYRFDPAKQKWTKVISPNGPAPRSAHQAVIHKGMMYVFGGEFTSPNQERFHHFKELWRLDLSTWRWDQLPSRGGPSARSGHRIAVHKNRLILFGGYYDTGRDVKYYNDLWVFDTEALKWAPAGEVRPGAVWPTARSGCQLAVHGDTLFMQGGYTKVPDPDDDEVEHGRALDDMYALDLATFTWERVKRAGMAPGARSSFAMVTHKARAFLFGGVSDNEAKGGEDLSSDFHNDLFVFNFDKRRWFAAEIRPPKQQKKADAETPAPPPAATASSAQGPSAASGSSALHKAATLIQSHFRGYMVRKAYRLYQLGGVVSEILYSPAAYGVDISSRDTPRPKARIAAQACVVGNTLWLLGGIVEIGDKEITLDDIWSLDLVKLDGWNLVKENTASDEVFKAAANAGSGSDSEWEEVSDEEGA